MKGYIALHDEDVALMENGEKIEVGKTYKVKGKVVPWSNGFQFFRNMESWSKYVNLSKAQVYEVDAGGLIETDKMEQFSSKMTVRKKLSQEEIKGYLLRNQDTILKHGTYHDKWALADFGIRLMDLLNDSDSRVKQKAKNYVAQM